MNWLATKCKATSCVSKGRTADAPSETVRLHNEASTVDTNAQVELDCFNFVALYATIFLIGVEALALTLSRSFPAGSRIC